MSNFDAVSLPRELAVFWKFGCASCMAVKQHLEALGVQYESLNAGDGADGEGRWKAAGSPATPALVFGNSIFPIVHTSQVDSLLDLAPSSAEAFDIPRLSWDSIVILEDWVKLLSQMDWDTIMSSTRSRGRTIRNLTVNVFDHFRLLPIAWDTLHFKYHTEESDKQLESSLISRESVIEYASASLDSFRSFIFNYEDDLQADRDVFNTKTQDQVSFAVLTHAQRRHAATHHRQVVAFIRAGATEIVPHLDVNDMTDLDLPESLY